jgi:hypothetical protein
MLQQLQTANGTVHLDRTRDVRSSGRQAAYIYPGRYNPWTAQKLVPRQHPGSTSYAEYTLQGEVSRFESHGLVDIDRQIREGMTVVTPPSASSSSATLDRKVLTSLFSPIGRCRFLEEKHFDACTALSGSGPAFACLMLEAMADGGVMMGLPRTEALELAAQSKAMSR